MTRDDHTTTEPAAAAYERDRTLPHHDGPDAADVAALDAYLARCDAERAKPDLTPRTCDHGHELDCRFCWPGCCPCVGLCAERADAERHDGDPDAGRWLS